jgi:hypothetical protein
MDVQDCFKLLNTDSGIGASEKEVTMCFGLSKMTVLDEVNSYDRYHRLTFHEFFEFIGRIAERKGKANIEWSPTQKVEDIMDNIFKEFKLERVEAE